MNITEGFTLFSKQPGSLLTIFCAYVGFILAGWALTDRFTQRSYGLSFQAIGHSRTGFEIKV